MYLQHSCTSTSILSIKELFKHKVMSKNLFSTIQQLQHHTVTKYSNVSKHLRSLKQKEGKKKFKNVLFFLHFVTSVIYSYFTNLLTHQLVIKVKHVRAEMMEMTLTSRLPTYLAKAAKTKQWTS